MSRTRWIALAAVFTSAVLLSGFTSGATTRTETADLPAAAPSTSTAASIGESRVEPPTVTAVDSARVPVSARAETRQPLRLLFTPLMTVAGACALIGRRGRSLGRVLELAIRAHSAFNGPAPGRRAPPALLAV